MNQAQLLSDVLYYPNGVDSQQWLIYYISKPLVGSIEHIKVTAAILPGIYDGAQTPSTSQNSSLQDQSRTQPSNLNKKDVKSFNGLLNNFPMIARQMQPGLELVFKEFHKEMGNRKSTSQSQNTTELTRKSSGTSSHSGSNGSIHSRGSNGHVRPPSLAASHVNEEEDHMRRILETAVTAAIDLFQLVDKQQLSFLGASTELTGPVVERLIEKYVTEQLHDSALFPSLCANRKLDDFELESQIHHMEHLDISQVGIVIEDGRQGKEHLMERLISGVSEFQKLGVAGSPQEMVEILLTTQKIITSSEPGFDAKDQNKPHGSGTIASEKPTSTATMNADSLVSLLLIVVVRAHVRHLQARLAYMRSYIFIEDVESGEIGYALSTFEAVLSYLVTDSGGLKKASRRNGRLWKAVRKGELPEVRAILQPSKDTNKQSVKPKFGYDNDGAQLHSADDQENIGTLVNGEEYFSSGSNETLGPPNHNSATPDTPTLAHVFPFQIPSETQIADLTTRKMKRVSMDMRSLSNSSEFSFKSRTASRTSTMDSGSIGIDGDTSVETLSQTQDSEGSSILMMAVDSRQPAVLGYLLNLGYFFPIEFILEDSNNEGTTLLSAAIQSAHTELIDIILQKIMETKSKQTILDYLYKADKHARTAAHYLFNAPHLIRSLGAILPWRLRDKNGQTPLLALCRSYDNSKYSGMINDALYFATQEQTDGQPLHLDDHVDVKGNTLLHVVNDPELAVTILRYCDADANAGNDKRFTPLMVASKYGRIDMVRAFFGDRRVDTYAKEYRGMTAVELAKDDEIRNRIDDMVLVSNIPAADGRVTAVVRSFFVEDASIRLIIKSAIRNDNGMIGVTTCRRSLADFENLAKWLSVEHPASWLPSIFNFRSPFQLPSKPSRAALQDIQVRLDGFLKIMIAHSTFSTHELLWEFILFPEIEPEMMAERSRMKAEIRAENVKEQFEPVEDVREIEAFVGHARDIIRGVNHSTKTVTRRVTVLRNTSLGMLRSKFKVSNGLKILQTSLLLSKSAPGLCQHFHSFQRTISLLLPGSLLVFVLRNAIHSSFFTKICRPFRPLLWPSYPRFHALTHSSRHGTTSKKQLNDIRLHFVARIAGLLDYLMRPAKGFMPKRKIEPRRAKKN